MVKSYLSITLFVSSLLIAQNGKITGEVNNKSDNSPLLGANIILENTGFGSATDSDGRYEIEAPQGDYNLIVSYIGFETLERKISIKSNQTITVNLELIPEAIELETYVVTASRRRERIEDAPAAISVISQAQIRRESNANLGDYIKGVKGIDFTQSGIDSYNMTARGFNSSLSSRLLTLMDGRMANVPSLRLTAYNVIPVTFDDVEQIEVVLGPASALYGPNAHSGVLNIVTSSPLNTQGTSLSVQGGMLNQADTDLFKKMNFRTAHKYKNFGVKFSSVVLAGQDWEHYNPDEFEGHDPAFIGRPNLINDGVDQLSRNNPTNVGEEGSIFTRDMLDIVEGSNPSWVGLKWADNIAQNEFFGEPGSPKITQEMIDVAATDPFNRYFLSDDITLWGVTKDKLGWAYADGIDNDGNGAIDNNIDMGIDDGMEVWWDGIDNDGDGLIDEGDEKGSDWLNRFGSFTSGTGGQKQGLGDYKYDAEGNIIFDTNNNGIYDDQLGSDGLDNDNDWAPFMDPITGDLWGVPNEPYIDSNGDGDYDVGEVYGDSIYIDFVGWILGLSDWGLDGVEALDSNGDGDYDDPGDIPPDADGTEGNGKWDGDEFTDLNGNGIWDEYDNLDLDGNGKASPGEYNVDEWGEGDFKMNYGNLPNIYKDANNDGISDYPDFRVRNIRYNFRADWEPSPDFSMIFSHGYAWARNINITGIARYLADGWIYRYYQTRTRWKNFFLQTYLNTSYSGHPETPTRNLATGSVIFDRSKKFSAQLQHANEFKNGKIRFVWGMDYFLTMPDTRGTILSDKNRSDLRDNNGNGEAGSPYIFNDRNDDTWYTKGEKYSSWSTDDQNQTQFATPLDSIGIDPSGKTIYDDKVFGAIKDGLDNDGDSDDYMDLNGNNIPDYVDSNGNGSFELGEQVEPGVRWLGNQNFIVYADGEDNDGDGRIDENIDEGIDEASEDNRYIVNEFGLYYQLNWKLNPKWEFIQATRLDAHDRLTNIIDFNNQAYGSNYSPFKWDFNFDKTNGLQVSPKIGIVHKPRENQNFRLTWATAFNTPSNQALFLDIFVTRVAIFKVYARGAGGGYVFPRDEKGRASYFSVPDADSTAGTYYSYNSDNQILFYPSTDPRIDGFYGNKVMDLPELEAEKVSSWEFGYKGRINQRLFGSLDVYTSHYSSFVSPVTFITPIVLRKSVLETDYNGDGVINNIDDVVDNDLIADQEDYDASFDNWRNFGNIQGITALKKDRSFTPPVVVGYVNYGEVDMWGLDGSLTYFFNLELSMEVTYSHLGMTEFFNPITKNKDPINAPRHKASMKIQYNPNKWPISVGLNGRYVDGFNWSSGIYYGDIKPYTIFDLHAGYEINEKVKVNLTLNNILNHKHVEIIGGPSLGRIALLRLTTNL